MRRFALLAVFAALAFRAFSGEGPATVDERTFEASRRGFQAIDSPGPLSREDFVRLLLRRSGEFRLPLTLNYREWRMEEPPDLWALDLPQVLRARIPAEGPPRLDGALDGLRLALGEVYNLPAILRNDTGGELDVKLTARLGDAGPSDGIRLAPGLNYVSLNLRPARTGRQPLVLTLFPGHDVPEGVSPPQSVRRATLRAETETVGWGELEVEILEDGVPVAARVTVFGSDGLAYAPEDGSALTKFTWTAGVPFFYARGAARLRLPVGRATLTAVRGFEAEPAREQITIEQGTTARVRLDLRRVSRVSEAGWWAGDSHIHLNYNDHEFLSPEDMLLQAEAEDLNVSNLMVANSSGAQIHDEQYFEGQPHRLSTERHLLRWIEEMRSNFYGHMCLPGIDRLIRPLYTGFNGTPQADDYPPNYDQAKAAQEAGGVAAYAHPGYRFTGDPFTMSARELPVDAALGVVEAMDVLSNSNERAVVPYYYRLLETGLRLVVSGGSDSFTNRRRHWLAGGQRVFVRTGKPTLDYGEWIEGYRAGRTYASNGPLMEFEVNGQPAGSELGLKPGAQATVRASARSLVSIGALEIVVNGEVVATATGPARELRVEHAFALAGPSWVAARVDGEFHPLVVNDARLFAHTTPVWLNVDGRRRRDPEAAAFFARWIDRLIVGVRERGRFSTPERREEVVALFERAKQFYLRR